MGFYNVTTKYPYISNVFLENELLVLVINIG